MVMVIAIVASMHDMKVDYQAVIFDMDGLLLDTESIALVAWTKAAQEFGYVLDKDLYCQLLGRTASDSKAILLALYGASFPFDKCRARRIEISQEHVKMKGISVKPGGFELLQYLSDNRVPRAVATSTRKEEALKKLEISKIDRFVDLGAYGDEVKNGKPHPDIFELAAERLNVDPRSCLVFEDSEAGAEAAYRAGMTCIIVPDLKYPSSEASELAYAVVESLNEGLSVVQNRFNFRV